MFWRGIHLRSSNKYNKNQLSCGQTTKYLHLSNRDHLFLVKQSPNIIDGDYCSCGHSTAAVAPVNGDYLYCSLVCNRGYLSCGKIQNKTETQTNTSLVNKGALERFRNIFKQGDRIGKRGSYTKQLHSHLTLLPSLYPTYTPIANPTDTIEHTYLY